MKRRKNQSIKQERADILNKILKDNAALLAKQIDNELLKMILEESTDRSHNK